MVGLIIFFAILGLLIFLIVKIKYTLNNPIKCEVCGKRRSGGRCRTCQPILPSEKLFKILSKHDTLIPPNFIEKAKDIAEEFLALEKRISDKNVDNSVFLAYYSEFANDELNKLIKKMGMVIECVRIIPRLQKANPPRLADIESHQNQIDKSWLFAEKMYNNLLDCSVEFNNLYFKLEADDSSFDRNEIKQTWKNFLVAKKMSESSSLTFELLTFEEFEHLTKP